MSFDTEEFMERQYLVGGIQISKKVDDLIQAAVPPNSSNKELYREMMLTVARMAQSDNNRWDAKIMMQTLKELESAFNMLDNFKRRRKVTVFGSARTAPDTPLYLQAKKLGQLLARHNLMVITGAGGGIMAAAHEGAGVENSIGLNIILPFEQGANDVVRDSAHLLTFHFFFLRKLFFVKEADALVLCPGGLGTMDEAWEVLTLIQTGKSPLVPVVLLEQEGDDYWGRILRFMEEHMVQPGYISAEDMCLLRLVHTPEDAVQEVASFYSNYHSTRWLRGHFVMRINHELSDAALATLNQQFSSLCKKGNIKQLPYCEKTHREPEFCNLFRLEFAFNARDFGRLRHMVNFINLPENWKNPV